MLQQEKFSSAMVSACKKALDQSIFYQDAFEAFVKAEMGGPDFKPVLMEKGTVDADDAATRREILKRVEEKVLAGPRGTYAVAKLVSANYPARYQSFMNDGSIYGRSDTHSAEPTEEQIVGHQMGMDIYSCRKAIEADQRRASEVVAFNLLQLAMGQVYKNFDDNGTKYSTVTIMQTFPEAGEVHIHCKKRGTNRMWENRIGAVRLARGLNLPHTHAMVEQAAVVSEDNEPDLFSAETDLFSTEAPDDTEEMPAPR